MDISDRIKLLTEGAKYDVSCSSSGGNTSTKKGFIGNTTPCGICHSFTSDGRCISLLKILLSNNCVYDCAYCASKRSNLSLRRVRISPKELCELVVGFYKRNYIEGLFLSSAVDISPNHTMQKLVQTVEMLRKDYGFRGYIHLKAIPGAHHSIIEYACRWVDRMSVNIELPSEQSLKLLAPQKKKQAITAPMAMLAKTYMENKYKNPVLKQIPAGQTTQMIIGASPDTDGQILRLTEGLYRHFQLKRVYYSAYSPIAGGHSLLPALPPDLRREHRLYEADWLLRFYGYTANELLPINNNLALDIDVKSSWALKNYGKFPLEIQSASHDWLLRVPGIGTTNAYRIFEARKYTKLSWDSLKKMRVVLNRARHFITINGKYYGDSDNPMQIADMLRDKKILPTAKQLSFFDLPSVITGEF